MLIYDAFDITYKFPDGSEIYSNGTYENTNFNMKISKATQAQRWPVCNSRYLSREACV